jgi:hypothetical protein
MRLRATIAALLLLPIGSGAANAGAEAAERLLGSWHVLVHYKDANAGNPDQARWEDRVWVFEKAGDRLEWTEYPIAVFADESGRFERRSTGQLARVLGYWEPNDAQRAEIAAGLELNSRGMKAKTLRYTRGSWQSASRPTAASASIVSYVESWSIEGEPDLPVFRREESLGGERTEQLDGLTLFTTKSVEGGGEVLKGEYERDGTRRGTFVIRRAGTGRALTTKRTQAERQRDAFLEAMRTRKLDPEKLTQEDRADLRQMIRSEVEGRMRRLGSDPAGRSREVDSLVSSIEKRMLAEQRTLGELPKIVEEAVVAP